jgi:predicted ABC-type ATPase
VSVLQKKPEVVVFAGPNGSGKSTVTELLKPPMDYINADEIKKYLKCSDLEAAQLAEKQREDHIKQMNLIEICDICHIYDNSGSKPFRILKKRKEKVFYDECEEWYYEDIQALTGICDMEKKNLNE